MCAGAIWSLWYGSCGIGLGDWQWIDILVQDWYRIGRLRWISDRLANWWWIGILVQNWHWKEGLVVDWQIDMDWWWIGKLVMDWQIGTELALDRGIGYGLADWSWIGIGFVLYWHQIGAILIDWIDTELVLDWCWIGAWLAWDGHWIDIRLAADWELIGPLMRIGSSGMVLDRHRIGTGLTPDRNKIDNG